MTSNLSMVTVLRRHATAACKMELDLTGAICNDAADEIERLEDENAALRECLRETKEAYEPPCEHEFVIDSERRPGEVFCLKCDAALTAETAP